MKLPTLLLVFVTSLATGSAADKDGFVTLFNGHDLNGWVNVNCAPETWSVSNGLIHCTGHPTGALRTPRQYENFILELDWRHLTSGGNSGIFIWGSPIAAPGVPFLRAIEVQVLDHGFNVPGKNQWYTTHGDVFPIHGASMVPFGRHNGDRSFPSEERSKGSPDWNHYRIECTNGVLRLHVNGKEVSGGEQCNYRKGYIGLESEGAPVEFRNVRVKELPATGATPEASAPQDQGWHSLFTGLDLRGWKTNTATAARWSARGEQLVQTGGQADGSATLWTESAFLDVEFVVDCHPGEAVKGQEFIAPKVHCGGIEIPLPDIVPGSHQRFTLTVRGDTVVARRLGKEARTFPRPAGSGTPEPFGLASHPGGLHYMNLYVRALR